MYPFPIDELIGDPLCQLLYGVEVPDDLSEGVGSVLVEVVLQRGFDVHDKLVDTGKNYVLDMTDVDYLLYIKL